MKQRRLWAALAAVALTATACGGDGDNEGTAAGPEQTPNFAGQKLTVWIMEGTNPDATGFFDAVSTEFTERTGGAELDIQFVQWANAHDKFTTSIAGGTVPDVAEVGTTWTPEFGEAGALTDLSEQIEGSELAYDLVPGLLESATVGDAVYGMPWYAGIRSFIYRTDVFTEAGVEVPQSWDDLVAAAEKIKGARPDLIPLPVPGDSEYGVYPFIWGNGAEIATEEGGEWTSQLDSPQAVEAIEFYTGLATNQGLSTEAATTWKETDLRDQFGQGKVAMMISGSWTPKAIVQKYPDLQGKIGAFPIPGPDGGLSPSFVGGSHLGVFEESDNQELAWEFVELMTSGEFAEQWAADSSFFPGLKSLVNKIGESSDPLVTPFAQQMNEAGKSVPVTPAYGAVQGKKTVPAMLQSILSGQKSVDQATSDAAAEMTQVMNQ